MALEINIGEEYKIKIEKEGDFKDSIFKEVYTQAAKNVDEIILQAQVKNDKESISNDDYNNVIAFTGERGTGKSSSMISFADALKNKNDTDTFWDKTEKLKNSEIVSLDVIDPSLFRNDDKLFEIIISKMFSKFQLELKKVDNKIINDNKRSLIKKFQKVFNNLKVVHNGKSDVYDKEAIEALSDLAFGTNLKDNFKKLVDDYLLCMYGIDNNKGKKGFLLIPIDDFDLNISGAYEMLEDIRQFLIQSNVIILIAFKMEQLQDSINNEIIKEYEMIFKYDTKAGIYLSENISNKSNKYLDKLFPLERRFNTPILLENNTSSKKMNLYDPQYEIDFIKTSKLNGEEISKKKKFFIEGKTIEDTFLGLVLKKTNILITKNEFEKNIIVPNTLRDLANTIKLIYKNEDINSFKTYLNKEITNNLSQKEVSFFKELEKTSNSMLNQFILNWIGINKEEYLFKYDTEETIFEPEIIKLTKIKKYYNASFGDILSILRELKNNTLITDIKNLYFINYLNIYYSIRYTELFQNNFNVEDLQVLTNDRLTNNFIKYLPKIRDKPKGHDKRDYFLIHKKPLELYEYLRMNLDENEFNSEIYFWVIHFFNFIGKGSLDTTYYINTIVDDIKNRKGNNYETITFNAISILNNLNNSLKLIDQYVPSNISSEAKESKLFEDLEKWNFKLTKEYYLIYNINLFDEILTELYNYANKKDSLGDNYGIRLHNYLYVGLKVVCERLSKKYNVNLIEIFDNPFFKYWNKNEDIINKVLHQLFKLSIQQESIKKYILEGKNLDSVNRFLSKSLPTLTKTKLTILINKLNIPNNNIDPKFLKEAWRIRNSINNNNIQEKKEEISELLNWLKSNG